MIVPFKKENLIHCLEILKLGYEKTAIQFGMTEENCPYRGRTCLPYNVFKEEYDKGYLMYAYKKENNLIGFLSLQIINEEMHINDIVIVPAYQNNGVGNELMQFAKEQAKIKHCNKIILGMVHDNIPLRSWYEKLGFKTVKLDKYETVDYTVGTMECFI